MNTELQSDRMRTSTPACSAHRIRLMLARGNSRPISRSVASICTQKHASVMRRRQHPMWVVHGCSLCSV